MSSPLPAAAVLLDLILRKHCFASILENLTHDEIQRKLSSRSITRLCSHPFQTENCSRDSLNQKKTFMRRNLQYGMSCNKTRTTLKDAIAQSCNVYFLDGKDRAIN